MLPISDVRHGVPDIVGYLSSKGPEIWNEFELCPFVMLWRAEYRSHTSHAQVGGSLTNGSESLTWALVPEEVVIRFASRICGELSLHAFITHQGTMLLNPFYQLFLKVGIPAIRFAASIFQKIASIVAR